MALTSGPQEGKNELGFRKFDSYMLLKRTRYKGNVAKMLKFNKPDVGGTGKCFCLS